MIVRFMMVTVLCNTSYLYVIPVMDLRISAGAQGSGNDTTRGYLEA